MSNPLVINIHIPKTAGSTLEGIYRSVYGDSYYRIPNIGGGIDYAARSRQVLDWDKLNCVNGHMSYGLHAVIPDNREPKYVTFLRDPGERLLSLFYHMKRRGRPEQDITFFDWIKSKRLAAHDNGMVRFLSGRYDVGYSMGFQQEVRQADYEQAVDNLSKFAFVGFTETFDKDIFALGDKLGWKVPEYENKLVLPHPKMDEIHYTIEKYLRFSQMWDYKLYDWAMENMK